MYKDKAQQKAKQKQHYEKHKAVYKARARKHAQEQAPRVRAVVMAAKAVPCVDCGIQYPPPVMEFDHVRGKKTMNVSEMLSGSLSLGRVLAEIAKCEVRCANCHRLRTWAKK